MSTITIRPSGANLTAHVIVTGCGLVQSDFMPNDPPCVDGGAIHEHPKD